MNMEIKQGEIWLINFDPSIGNEIQKTRPAVVINDNNMGRLGLYLVVPITEWKDLFKQYTWIIKVEDNSSNGLNKTSAFECFQIKSFSKQRFVRKIGEILKIDLINIHQTVIKTLNPLYEIN